MHQDGKRMPYWKLGTAGACFKRRFQVVISERQASAASVTASRRRQGAIYNASVPCSTRLLIRVSSSVSPILIASLKNIMVKSVVLIHLSSVQKMTWLPGQNVCSVRSLERRHFGESKFRTGNLEGSSATWFLISTCWCSTSHTQNTRPKKIERAKTRQDFVADSLCSKLVSAFKIPSSVRWRSGSKAASAWHFGHRLSAHPANRKEAEKKERKRPPGGRARHTAGRFRCGLVIVSNLAEPERKAKPQFEIAFKSGLPHTKG